MSSLLPIFVSPQNGSNAISGGGTATEPAAQVSKDQSSSFGHAFSPDFAQVLREQHVPSTFLDNLQVFGSTEVLADGTAQFSPPQQHILNLEIPLGPKSIEKVLQESPANRTQAHVSPEVSVLPSTAPEVLREPSTLLVTKGVDASFAATNEFIQNQAQKFLFEHGTFPVAVPTIPLAPLTGNQTPANGLLQGQAVQSSSQEPTLGSVKQALYIEGAYSGKASVSLPTGLEAGLGSQQVSSQNVPKVDGVPQHVLLPKVDEGGVVSPPASQGTEGKRTSFLLKQEEGSLAGIIAPSAKDVPSGVTQAERSILRNETQPTPLLPQGASLGARLQNVSPNPLHPATAIQAEGPAGFTRTSLTNQIALTTISGNSAVLSELAGLAPDHRTSVPADLSGETGLLVKGERDQAMTEASMKSTGLDPSGGQGLGSGMNHSPQSQSRFQEPSMFPGQGVGIRGVERGQEFPTPALQRLQMDVQVSETQRVSIDVGVQNRLVSAGLVMDHSVLRNLANQFVPQLENQLADVDMELKEFSAEVREERQQKDESLFDHSKFHKAQESGRDSQEEGTSPIHQVLKRQEEQGLHFVA